jgi:hypothetical protein
MDTFDSLDLPLQLRRDRGYVYFPDAISSCLERFGLERSPRVRAECYKISDRQIRVQEIRGEFAREPDVFGSLALGERGFERRFVLREQAAKNPARYDLFEPVFDFELSGTRLIARENEAFTSLFHRWAVCCKKLYHRADPGPGRRMLLQRIETSAPRERAEETFRLEFMTPERFMKFGVLQNGERVGEVIAAAKEMS